MNAPHRWSLLAVLLLFSLIALPWAVCASAAGGQSNNQPLSGGGRPTIMLTPTPLGCDTTTFGSIVNPSLPDSYTIAIPTDQVISVSVAPVAPVGPNFQPAWRLRDAHGIFVPPYSSFNVWGTQVLVDTLRASGSPRPADARQPADPPPRGRR